MAVMEVALLARIDGEQVINRWNYIASGTPAAVSRSFALFAALGGLYTDSPVDPGYPEDKLLWLLANSLHNSVVFEQISIMDVHSDTDFYESPFVQELKGGRGGDSLPPYDAISYRTNKIKKSVGRGFKRFAGINEGDQNLGRLGGGYIEAYAKPLAEEMSKTLSYDDEGNVVEFRPAVCSKNKIAVPDKPGKFQYKYWPTAAQQEEHSAIGVVWAVQPNITTQVSRKRGRGR